MLPSMKVFGEALARYAESTICQAVENIQTLCPVAQAPTVFGLAAPDSRLEDSILNAIREEDGCRSIGERVRLGPICRRPDYRKKSIPPFQYGYCKEEEEELPLFCPRTKKRGDKARSCCQEIDGKTCQD